MSLPANPTALVADNRGWIVPASMNFLMSSFVQLYPLLPA